MSTVINDTFQHIPIVVPQIPDRKRVWPSNGTIKGHVLTFELAEGQDGGEIVTVDRETGSRWSALTGETVLESLTGTVLTRFLSDQAFWFAWTGFYRYTEGYGQ